MSDVRKKFSLFKNENTKNLLWLDRLIGYLKNPLFILLVVLHILYFFVFFNLFIKDKDLAMKFYNYSNQIAQFIISAYLIIRFNPLRKHDFNDYDAFFIFWGGVFLLASLGFSKYIENYILHTPVVQSINHKIDNVVAKHFSKTDKGENTDTGKDPSQTDEQPAKQTDKKDSKPVSSPSTNNEQTTVHSTPYVKENSLEYSTFS